MKKIVFIATIVLLSLFLFISVNNSKYAIFNDVEYISKYHSGNKEMFLNFMTKVSKNEKSKVLLTDFTDEGEPIFYRIEYNGEYFELIEDTREDSFGQKKVYKTKYLNIEERVDKTSGTTIIYYVLINDEDEFSLRYLLDGW